jgi:DNA polymerase III subunit delta'
VFAASGNRFNMVRAGLCAAAQQTSGQYANGTPRMSKADNNATPESDRFGETPHPRMTYELFGHDETERQLLEAYRNRKLPQSLILAGPEGIGKATLAWRFVRFLMANPDPASSLVNAASSLFVDHDHPAARKVEALAHSDIFLLRREWNLQRKRHYTEIRVDDVRELIGRFQQSASGNGWRTAIIDPVDDLNHNSANALLKLIEEPPPRSLFLFVANRPAQILATIRSRSQILTMAPLAPDDVSSAVSSLGKPWSAAAPDDLGKAIERGHGSVRDSLRFLESNVSLLDDLDGLLGQLPRIDWGAVHVLSEALAPRDKTQDFEAVIASVLDWLSLQLKIRTDVSGEAPGAQIHASSLAPLADLWEKIATQVRQVETYNLDRRPFLLTLFSDLAAVAQPHDV